MRYLKAIKNNGTMLFAMRVGCFLALSYLLYVRLDKERGWDLFRLPSHFWPLCLFVGLIPFNWGLEALKYQRVLSALGLQVSRKVFWKSFSAGIVSGMLTPNMLGNFIGRNLYFQRKNRPSLILLTLWSNHAQFVCSVLFGLFSLFFLWKVPFQGNLTFIALTFVALVSFSGLFYFLGEHLAYAFFPKRRWVRHLSIFDHSPGLKVGLFLLSSLRHMIFTLQFMLVLYAFGIDFNLSLLFWTWQTYLWVTLAPSLFLGKLVVRESVNVWVLTAAGMPSAIVLLASLVTWFGNLFVPTLISIFAASKPRNTWQ
jgi:hypothetical protein